MRYDFDREISRQGTGSVKWEYMREAGSDQWRHTDACFGKDRFLPMWIADMDFASPQPVIDALAARAQHGIFGYTQETDSYYAALAAWMQRRQGWQIAPEWVCTTPGVIPALDMLVQTFVAPGEKVLVQPPVYYPFFSAIQSNGGEVLNSPLILTGNRYGMDFADLAQKTRDPQLRMAILCSPHNPVGRVWTKDELLRFGEICLERDILIVSDEIHGDLIYSGHTFTPFASISEAFAQRTIVCTAPSKTFNLAGLQASNIIIPNEALRCRFESTLHRNGVHGLNLFGIVATETAYREGEEWLDQVLDYIGGNLRYLQQYVAEHIPQIRVVEPEGTYLVWLDCRALGLDAPALQRLMLQEARIHMNDGSVFGIGGEGFVRMNIACPRAILAEALSRIHRAVALL